MSDKPEVIEFYLTAPRYIRQAGQIDPEYVRADPQMPVLVRLPAVVYRRLDKRGKINGKEYVERDGETFSVERAKPDKFLTLVKPDKPKETHAQRVGPLSVTKAADRDKKFKGSQRAADK